jgi:hypothetical protein
MTPAERRALVHVVGVLDEHLGTDVELVPDDRGDGTLAAHMQYAKSSKTFRLRLEEVDKP